VVTHGVVDVFKYAHEMALPPMHVPIPLHTAPVMHTFPVVHDVPTDLPVQSVTCAKTDAINSEKITSAFMVTFFYFWDQIFFYQLQKIVDHS